MPRINLLPWREELRKRRQREFGFAAAGAFVLGLGVVFGCIRIWGAMTDHQNARNQLLRAEIAVLDEQIQEIRGLEAQKQRLLARMEIIEELQRSRPEVVHLFDELANQLPDGVYFTQVRQVGQRVELRGVAQSSTRVSALMRQLDGSPWLTNPGLSVVETRQDGSVRSAQFTVFVNQVSTTDREEEGGS
jgi:type IV pilus assembly protein PilN